jgi:hypothetical protein
MFELPRAPRGDQASLAFIGSDPTSAFGNWIRVALEHHKRGSAGRIRCRKKRRCRERAVEREEDRFAAA